jgi:CDP-6-deoxy-D-xylo-4-hexulose-3-dehydrase
MGATWSGKYTGTFGLCGTFSTFFSHHIATMEGGVVLTDDEEMYHIMLSMRSHGWTRHLPQENMVCEKSSDPFYESFRFVLPGYNLRPVEMSGAIGLEQLKKLDGFISKRRENAAHFCERFSNDARFILQRESGASSWFGFSLVVRPDVGLERGRIIQALNAANIDVRPVVTGNFLVNDVIKHLNHRVVGEHVNSQIIHDNGFFVGNHHFDIRTKIDYLFQVLETV